MSDLLAERGLPCNIDAERLVLGSILLDGNVYDDVAGALQPADFSLDKHQRIFTRMAELHERGERIDRITVANELRNRNELESCDGLSYLVSLDDGLPQIATLDAYIRIVQEKSTLRRAIEACEALINRCISGGNDSSGILAAGEALLARIAAGQVKHGQWLQPGEIMENYPGGFENFIAPNRAGSGAAVPTPWKALTSATCGLQTGDLVLVAGRPSMGKSIVGMQLAHTAARNGHGSAVFSLEMSKESLVRRLISAVGNVDAQRIRSGLLNAEERQRSMRAAAEIKNLPIYVDDTRARTVPAVTAALRKLIAKHPIRLLIIDHLQLMRATGRSESRHQELSEISHSLKHLAGEFGVTVVLLSQLNRDCEREKRRPQLADLKETGSLEEDADLVLFVHRPEQFNRQDQSLHGVAELIIGKQRNGPTGKLNMVFLHEFQKFEERAWQASED